MEKGLLHLQGRRFKKSIPEKFLKIRSRLQRMMLRIGAGQSFYLQLQH